MLNDFAAGNGGLATIEALLSHSQDCVKLLDLEGNLSFMSDNGIKAMEVGDFSKVRGRKWRELWPDTERQAIDSALEKASGKERARFQGFCPTGQGQPRWWDVVVSPLLDSEGNVAQILATSRDISYQYTDAGREDALRTMVERLQAERQQLAAAKAELVHLEKIRLLGQFAGGIVHDLNNILATMSIAAQLLRRRVDSPVANDILNHVDQAVLRGAELTRQLLDFSRKDVGAAEVVNLQDLLASDLSLMRHLVGPDIKLELACEADVAPVLAPSSRLRSVLFNLLSNSRDAMNGEGDIKIRVGHRKYYGAVGDIVAGNYSYIEVIDDGAGMAPEVIAKLGGAFFTTKARGKGTGLGMPSAFELASMCSGAVEIESAPGSGTTVRILMRSSDVAEEQDASAHDEIDPLLHGNATVLLIENDIFLRQHLAGCLQGLGYSVLEATSAQTAVEAALTAAKIDLIISDLSLDESTGNEAVALLRQNAPSLPAIFISGLTGKGTLPGEVFLRKPVRESVLATAMLEQLGRLPARKLTRDLLMRSERIKARLKSPAMIAAYDAWRSACMASHRLPSREALASVEKVLLSTSYLAEVRGSVDLLTFRYLTVSPRLEEQLGRPLTGTYVTSDDADKLGPLARSMTRCLSGIAYYDYAKSKVAGESHNFERLLLPLSGDGRSVTHILGIVIFN